MNTLRTCKNAHEICKQNCETTTTPEEFLCEQTSKQEADDAQIIDDGDFEFFGVVLLPFELYLDRFLGG